MDTMRIEMAVKELLLSLGENPEREGLKDTPKRVAKMYEELLSGTEEDAEKQMQTYFNELHSGDLVLVSNIEFYSLCEHHLLPFFGKAHIAYIPNGGKVLGLSKLGRIVVALGKRLQVQERLTSLIGSLIMKNTNSHGVYVVVEAEHLCMAMRGIKSKNTKTITSVALGNFKNNDFLKMKVLQLIK